MKKLLNDKLIELTAKEISQKETDEKNAVIFIIQKLVVYNQS